MATEVDIDVLEVRSLKVVKDAWGGSGDKDSHATGSNTCVGGSEVENNAFISLSLPSMPTRKPKLLFSMPSSGYLCESSTSGQSTYFTSEKSESHQRHWKMVNGYEDGERPRCCDSWQSFCSGVGMHRFTVLAGPGLKKPGVSGLGNFRQLFIIL